MSKLVATVNNKKVYSDKSLSGIVNGRLNFSDGSWCDVSTGQVVNKGAGYISIGAPQQSDSSDKITIGPKSFSANVLEVSNLSGVDVDVQVHAKPEIEVTIDGPEDIAKGINLSQSGTRLLVEGDTNGSGINVTGVRIGNITQISGSFSQSISIGGSNEEENDTKILIKLPKGTPILLSGVNGTARLGDIESSLTVKATGHGKVFTGKMSSANIDITGSTDVTIDEVSGNIQANIMGSGDIEINDGQAQNVQVSIMGSGDFEFGGKAENASLTIMGSGDIKVAHVINKPRISKMGSGDIKVRNWK